MNIDRTIRPVATGAAGGTRRQILQTKIGCLVNSHQSGYIHHCTMHNVKAYSQRELESAIIKGVDNKIQVTEIEERLISNDKKILSVTKELKQIESDSDQCSLLKEKLEKYTHKKAVLQEKLAKLQNDVPQLVRSHSFSTALTCGQSTASSKTCALKPRFVKQDDTSSSHYNRRISSKFVKQFTSSPLTCCDQFKIKSSIWDCLFDYQKEGVKWLWMLHNKGTGGILGDEMGLGKTIQVISFLSSLKSTATMDVNNISIFGCGPVLLLCPATIIYQWMAEFHAWSPDFRVVVLHMSNSQSIGKESDILDEIMSNNTGVVISTYSTFVSHSQLLTKYDWHYVVLDEGHKIRNPNAIVTVRTKELRTNHRIILSGTPVQNNLKELWCLFDFVCPGLLGTLADFQATIGVPIVQGGYSTSSRVQVHAAYRCACVLREAIQPHLLRRSKDEVNFSKYIPAKNEQVLFCELSDEQLKLYRQFIGSSEVGDVLKNRAPVLPSLIKLRKICNHPSILLGTEHIDTLFNSRLQEKRRRMRAGIQDHDDREVGDRYSSMLSFINSDNHLLRRGRSGKIDVLGELLRVWHNQRRKVLIFSQTKTLLDVIEKLVIKKKYQYIRMDGATTISKRNIMIERFNNDTENMDQAGQDYLFAFLLTTKVGGLGINLTGASRVVIFDPDWNPCVDTQAKDRVHRYGQLSEVVVYRLLCAGTIEEKIYERQIYKHYLGQRILNDPKQRRFFKLNKLNELFTLTGYDKKVDSKSFGQEIIAGTGDHCEVTIDSDVTKTKEYAMAKELSRRLAQPSSVVDGERVAGVKKRKRHAEETYPLTNSSKKKSSSDYVLQQLLSKGSIRGAIDHGQVAEKSEADYSLIELEARKIAEKAVETLRQSGAKLSTTILSNAATSSDKTGSVLDCILQRNRGAAGDISQDENEDVSLVRQLFNLLKDNSGRATTEEILDKFSTLPPSKSMVLKQALKTIATLTREHGVGRWVLKSGVTL